MVAASLWLLEYRKHLHGGMKAHIVNTTSQYNLPLNKVNLKNFNAGEQLNTIFADPVVERNINLDMAVIECSSRAESGEIVLRKTSQEASAHVFLSLKKPSKVSVEY